MEEDEKMPAEGKELSFEDEQAVTDTLAEMKKAGGIIAYLEQRRKKKVPPQTSP